MSGRFQPTRRITIRKWPSRIPGSCGEGSTSKRSARTGGGTMTLGIRQNLRMRFCTSRLVDTY
jgi:hypothetical protein